MAVVPINRRVAIVVSAAMVIDRMVAGVAVMTVMTVLVIINTGVAAVSAVAMVAVPAPPGVARLAGSGE